MSSRGTGLTLSLGILAAIVGYILWQLAIGFNTKADEIQIILTNSSTNGTNFSIALILIAVGLTVHAAGLMSTRGTAAGTAESIGIYCIMTAILVWVVSTGLGFALIEMGGKFVAAAAGALAVAAQTDARSIAVAAGFTQAANVAANTIGSLLAGIGWISIGIAYRGSDAKGALSFIPLGWLALIAGLILVIANLVINQVASIELASKISSISFLLIVIWSVSRGLALIKAKNKK